MKEVFTIDGYEIINGFANFDYCCFRQVDIETYEEAVAIIEAKLNEFAAPTTFEIKKHYIK